MDLPKRKSNRLENYDYNSAGAYFITVCTKNRQNLLCDIVGEGLCALPSIKLFPIGLVIKESIEYINKKYIGVSINKYVIMPNHIHLLVRIKTETGGHRAPPLQSIIGNFKSYTTHKYGGVLWQRSFYDHIVRNENEYNKIWEYIDQNPLKWENDELFPSK